jgi:hypothetical protein
VVFGSGVLVRSLAEAGPLANFRLADSVTTATGVIIATYQKKESY